MKINLQNYEKLRNAACRLILIFCDIKYLSIFSYLIAKSSLKYN